MDFEKIPIEWKNKGLEPSSELKEDGFIPGYKPAASEHNFLFARIFDCITEIQKLMNELDENKADYTFNYKNNYWVSMREVFDAVYQLEQTVKVKANLASPTFTGTPKAPTASAGTNTTQIATTAFVQSCISDVYRLLSKEIPDNTSTTAYDPDVPWVYVTVNRIDTNNTGWIKCVAVRGSDVPWCVGGDSFGFYNYVTGAPASFKEGDEILFNAPLNEQKYYIMPSDITWGQLCHAIAKRGF
jgi:hypothetical protein